MFNEDANKQGCDLMQDNLETLQASTASPYCRLPSALSDSRSCVSILRSHIAETTSKLLSAAVVFVRCCFSRSNLCLTLVNNQQRKGKNNK